MNDSVLQRLWKGIKCAFIDAGVVDDNDDAQERAMSGSRLYEQVNAALWDLYGEQWPWIHDLFFDNERAFVIFSTEGKLYQSDIEMMGESRR